MVWSCVGPPFPRLIPVSCLPYVESSPHSPCEGLPSEAALTPRPEGKVPSRLALGSRGGYNGRGWGSPGRPKKKHTGNNPWDDMEGRIFLKVGV